MFIKLKDSKGAVAMDFMFSMPLLISMIVSVFFIFLLIAKTSSAIVAAQKVSAVSSVYDEASKRDIYERFELWLSEDFGFLKNRLTDRTSEIVVTDSIDSDIFRTFLLNVSSHSVDALPPGLDDRMLRESDVPSPYCVRRGGYRLCGF